MVLTIPASRSRRRFATSSRPPLTPTQGNQGTVEGEITTILCLEGSETESQLFITFEGPTSRPVGEVRFTGTFELTGGTGVFDDITGEGKITGAFTCLRREATCAQLGVLSDAVFSLQGTYSDPTT